jgi:hypothetical protein
MINVGLVRSSTLSLSLGKPKRIFGESAAFRIEYGPKWHVARPRLVHFFSSYCLFPGSGFPAAGHPLQVSQPQDG